jgi:hypothetical protein
MVETALETALKNRERLQKQLRRLRPAPDGIRSDDTGWTSENPQEHAQEIYRLERELLEVEAQIKTEEAAK